MKIKWLLFIAAFAFIGCKKDLNPTLPNVSDDLTSSAAATAPLPITLNVDPSQPGFAIPTNFEGLSYETGLLIQNPEFLNENNAPLIQLIKNLGKGVLRIGGNTSDEINWQNGARTTETPETSLTTTEIDRLTAFSNAINWPVLFGLNLANKDAAGAAQEATYVYNSLQGKLIAFQSGNEPEVFHFKVRPSTYSYSNYQTEWETYYKAVKTAVPKANFAGPDVGPFNPSWISSFADAEHTKIKFLDTHFYNAGPASNPSITFKDILTINPQQNGFLLEMSKISAQYKFPYRVSECNNIWGGGKPGVSDTFASALWALDFMWNVAENKGQGINFHGGQPRFAYTPLTMENGTVTARPEYYAMLAFKQATPNSKIIPATIVNPRADNNCAAYACLNADNSYSVTLINKETSKSFSFTVNLTAKASTISVARLMAPSITSTTGTTFAGSAVNVDGTFTPAAAKLHTVDGKSFAVTVPAGSAAIVTVKN